MLSSSADPAGASLTITQQPANATTAENVPVTFTVAAVGSTPFGSYTSGAALTPEQGGAVPLGTTNALPIFYQWYTNGVEVAGANSTNYTIVWPKKAQDGMKVKCYVALPGFPLDSSEATLTVTADTTPPTVVKVTPDRTFTKLTVNYSEPVTDTALTASNYTLDQSVTVSSLTRVDLSTVQLTTSKMVENTTYNLTVRNVQDTATPPNAVAANTTVQFQSFVYVAGTVLHKKYNNIPDNTGTSPDNLFADARYPNNPDRQDLLSMWEYPAGATVELQRILSATISTALRATSSRPRMATMYF
jgi:hypothetical protein